MPIDSLADGLGKGRKKVSYGTASLADGDTVDTGLSSVDSAMIETRGNTAGTAGALQLATATSVSGGTLTADVATIDATDGGAAQATAETMAYQAVGEV